MIQTMKKKKLNIRVSGISKREAESWCKEFNEKYEKLGIKLIRGESSY